ncbi:hypothetical protein CDL15_Pgr012072 [Punica granatum]|uniref:ABC-type xenobiotic transporter n=2 Tax=Punica granatum TaxID=22663 RepID=A0A218XNE3_PUNGR|nr:hypothetical protein CDL15_Pgr012072 [Punica granatum]
MDLCSHFSALMIVPGSGFLFQTVFLRGFSASLHLVLLLVMLVWWLCRKLGVVGAGDGSKGGHSRTKLLYHRMTLFCCLSLSVLNLALCLLSYFFWYRSGWSDEKLVTLIDLAVRTVAWGAVCVYLRRRFPGPGQLNLKLPVLLRVWWVFFLSISCYCLVVDFLLYKKYHVSIPVRIFISDGISVVSGLFLCYVVLGQYMGGDSDAHLEEPLINGTSNSNGCTRNDEGSELSKTRGTETVTPYSKAGIFGYFTFSWMSPLIAFGNKKILDLEDVPQLDSDDSLVGAFPKFKSKLQVQLGEGLSNGVTTFRLVKALISFAWKEILITALCALVYTVASYVGPYLIDAFVQYLSGRRAFENEGYFLVSAFLIGKLVECISQRQWFFKLQQVGIRARAVLVAMIYEKGLTLSCHSKQGQTSGEIINFMSVDAERVGDFVWYMHDPWMVLLQVTLALIILYKNLGHAAIASLVATILVMLANLPLASLLEKFQERLMKSKDKRMKATSEILRNMRILKLQAWEMKFLSKIRELRGIEAGWLKKFVYTRALTSFVFWGAPTFVSVATFAACMLLGIQLESGKILSALATFRILQEPIYNLPDTISMIIQTKVSLDRIASFLSLDDQQKDGIEKLPPGSTDTAVEIINGTFSWDSSSSSVPTLKDINLKVLRGMRVAVCGTVGSGKSSFLSCILGEVPKVSGIVRLCGTKAYVAQSPWIQSGKIEDNILFGKEMDRARYERVLEACCLKKDLEILSFGDQTVIGERGINLSGGQKQRIQIARALYQDADIYLFDDPFSAVDAHTGSHLFKECLLGHLSTKTVIYVTHQVEFLPAADLILVMKDGKIIEAGKYDDILRAGTDFMELVGAHKTALSGLDSVQVAAESEGSSGNIENGNETSPAKALEKTENRNVQNAEPTNKAGQLIQEEEREKGSVGFPVYWKYITTAYGGALVPFILLAHVLFQGLQIGGNFWMAWATPVSPDAEPPVTGSTLLLVYVALSIGSSFCVLIRTTLLATALFKTAALLFDKMHHCIFRAPMSFFDSTPSGRILNRASTDQSAVDTNVPYLVAAFAFALIQLFGIIGVMSQVAWQVFIVFIPILAVCVWYQHYYIAAARELSRLVGVCKAPVIQHFAETIAGSTTIRSFDQESRFRQTNVVLSDGYSRPKFHIAGAMEWLCFRLDVLSSVVFGFSLIFLISVPEGFIDPAIAGLVVTYGLNLNMLQVWVIWNLCTMENQIISVERILQYATIPSEPPLVIEENRPKHSWPSHGEISIQNLQVRYAPHMPLVLRGISCTFPGGMKTGIVGRTGSGKSTLIQTLFRIVDPAGGHIMIDGINICSIGVHDLRSRLSIIPQDPTMFEGTVRGNLDPLEEYTDEQIWEALDKCQLGDEVRKKEGKLDSAVSENGENWSMGQRQLVCLGRILLKKSKVLVLDEATASVDTATDNLIQQTLKEHFSDCTVITIAHRITSILDSDTVLLLDHGLICEYDSPRRLLEDKSSSFSQLVMEYAKGSNS